MDLNDAKSILKKAGARRIQKSLRRWREDVYLSQAELARQAGIAQETISRIESGTRNLTPRIFALLADAIDKAFDKKRVEAAKSVPFSSIVLPEHPERITSLSLLSPEEERSQETHERVQSKLIEAMSNLIRVLEEELALRGERETKQVRKIANLEKRIREYRDLLGLETIATVSRVEADELRESLTVAGMRKENEEDEE